MPKREALICDFLRQSKWYGCARETIAGDASNRRYERLRQDPGHTAILMDAPPDKGESTEPFVRITNFLRGVGLSAPEIFAQDNANGFLLIEDFGDDLFAGILSENPNKADMLYQAATDVLLHLHAHTPPRLTRCDADFMTEMVEPAFTWYQRNTASEIDANSQEKIQNALHNALLPLDDRTNVLIQRDYHAENLIWLPDRSGVARVGLLDYQDALIGHRAYDLVSILQDARRDVSPEIADAMITRYVDESGVSRSEFEQDYALLGLQRNLRILGIFVRLSRAHGKPHYVNFIPRVWDHIQTNLKHPALHKIAMLINSAMPKPTPKIIQGLKEKCATLPTQ